MCAKSSLSCTFAFCVVWPKNSVEIARILNRLGRRSSEMEVDFEAQKRFQLKPRRFLLAVAFSWMMKTQLARHWCFLLPHQRSELWERDTLWHMRRHQYAELGDSPVTRKLSASHYLKSLFHLKHALIAAVAWKHGWCCNAAKLDPLRRASHIEANFSASEGLNNSYASLRAFISSASLAFSNAVIEVEGGILFRQVVGCIVDCNESSVIQKRVATIGWCGLR